MAVISSSTVSCDLTDDTYKEKLVEWNEQWCLGIPCKAIDSLVSQLLAKSDPLASPRGLIVETGKEFRLKYTIAMAALYNEVREREVPFTAHFGAPRVSPFDERNHPVDCQFASTPLRIGVGSGCEGMTLRAIRRRKDHWPGIEAIWFLALNPEILFRLGDTELPYLIVPGITVKENNVLRFRYDRIAGVIVDSVLEKEVHPVNTIVTFPR